MVSLLLLKVFFSLLHFALSIVNCLGMLAQIWFNGSGCAGSSYQNSRFADPDDPREK